MKSAWEDQVDEEPLSFVQAKMMVTQHWPNAVARCVSNANDNNWYIGNGIEVLGLDKVLGYGTSIELAWIDAGQKCLKASKK